MRLHVNIISDGKSHTQADVGSFEQLVMVPSENTGGQQRLRHRHRRIVVDVLGVPTAMQFDHPSLFDRRIPAQGTFGQPYLAAHRPAYGLLQLEAMTTIRHIAQNGMWSKAVSIDEVHLRQVVDSSRHFDVPAPRGRTSHSTIVEHSIPSDALLGSHTGQRTRRSLRQSSSLPLSYHGQQEEQTTYYNIIKLFQDFSITGLGTKRNPIPTLRLFRWSNGQASKNVFPLASSGRAIPGYSQQKRCLSRSR